MMAEVDKKILRFPLDLAARTRFPTPMKPNGLTAEEKITLITHHMEAVLSTLGLDLENDSLKETPARIARMYVSEIFRGLDENDFPALSLFDDPVSAEEGRVISIKKIRFCSFCEHHFVPMIGKAQVAYIPSGRVIGLSKINRIVRYFAARPQLQERLTGQIHDSLKIILGTDDVAVALSATHTCVALRGVADAESSTATYAISGRFQNDPLRAEFFQGFHQ